MKIQIGNFNYSLVVKKTPIIKKLEQETKKALEKHGVFSDFSITGSMIECRELESLILKEKEEDLFKELIGIGRKYGIDHFSVPYWYYPK